MDGLKISIRMLVPVVGIGGVRMLVFDGRMGVRVGVPIFG